MNVCNPVTLRAYAPAMVGWCLALAACLRAEQLRGDLHAQALLPVLQGGAVALLVFTLSCIGAASIMLWRVGRNAVE
ncbi:MULTISPECIES: hypothetical protein [unclassified Stenotrophomonas]|uniref:hypothetical protein n=1 Tax=unclassified Stenotrophomonas TaxID=196198 RepID=UPI0012B49C84|nr:hypothetical protein FEO91_13045 [Stenotrophomonas maltophilia]